MSDGVVMLLNIKEHKTILSDNGQARIEVKDVHNKKFTHFINEEDGTWSKQLTDDGKQVYVYMMEKPNPKYPKFPYRNIYKPRDDAPLVPTTDSKGIPVSPAPVLPDAAPEPPPGFFDQAQPPVEEPKKYRTDKDIEIRWQLSEKCSAWIVAAIIQRSKELMKEQEIKNYALEYANYFNSIEPGMTIDTLPISKAQVIELHNRLTYHGIAKPYYHAVLSKILGKQVIKTTDLTYTEASQCLREFDETLDEMREALPEKDIPEPNPFIKAANEIRKEVLSGALNDDDGNSSLPF